MIKIQVTDRYAIWQDDLSCTLYEYRESFDKKTKESKGSQWSSLTKYYPNIAQATNAIIDRTLRESYDTLTLEEYVQKWEDLRNEVIGSWKLIRSETPEGLEE